MDDIDKETEISFVEGSIVETELDTDNTPYIPSEFELEPHLLTAMFKVQDHLRDNLCLDLLDKDAYTNLCRLFATELDNIQQYYNLS